MKFCPNCATRMKLKRTKNGDITIMTFQCGNCGESQQIDEPITSPEIETSKDEIKVVGEDIDVKTMPTLDILCPKCKNDEAYWWLLQTRGGDEATTQFYRCTKCNYTWREYA